MTKPSIETKNQDHFIVHGEINFANAEALRQSGTQLINQSKEPTFDLHGVTSSDNVILAILTAWVRQAKNEQKKLHFINLSGQLLDMAKVSGLSELLPIVT